MRLLLLLAGAAVGAAALAPVAGPGTTAGRALPAARLGTLRVCTYSGFSHARQECVKDGRSAPLTSNRFVCSVRVDVRRAARLRARFTFGGQTQYTTSWKLSRGSWIYRVDLNIGIDLPLPAGNWGCDYSVGAARVKAAFTSGGPTGAVVDLAACPGLHAVHPNGLTICPRDEAPGGLPAADRILCNGVLVGQIGKVERIDLVSGDGTLLRRGQEGTVRAPMWVVFQTFAAEPPGSYACRISLDDAVAAEHPFPVTG